MKNIRENILYESKTAKEEMMWESVVFMGQNKSSELSRELMKNFFELTEIRYKATVMFLDIRK